MAKRDRGGYFPGDEKFEPHESYGLIRFSRVQGGVPLFGSPIRPLNFITLTITDAERTHGLGGDHFSDGKIQCQVYMSETQFAEFITTPNRGCGVPCTFHYKRDDDGFKECEDPPLQETEAAVTRRHFVEDVADKMGAMRDARERVAELMDKTRMSGKAKDEILDEIFQLMRMFEDSAPFVMKRFEENVEKVVGHARTEVTTHARLVAEQTGLAYLEEQASSMLLEGDATEPSLKDRLVRAATPQVETPYKKCAACEAKFPQPSNHPLCVLCDADFGTFPRKEDES